MAGGGETAVFNHWSQIWPSWHTAKAKKNTDSSDVYFWLQIFLPSVTQKYQHNKTQPVFHIHDIQPAGKGKTCIGCYLCWVCHRQIHHAVRACVSHDALLQKSGKTGGRGERKADKGWGSQSFPTHKHPLVNDDVRERVEGPQETNILSVTEERSRSSADKTFPRQMIMCIQIFPFWPIDTFLRMTERRRERKSSQGGFKQRTPKFTSLKFRMKKKKTLRCISKPEV